LIVMTSRLVPTAARMAIPRTLTRAGTARKPPPTPRNPVTAPSPAPAAPAFPGRTWPDGFVCTGRSIRRAASPATTAKATVSTGCARWPAAAPASIAGTMPAAANSSPVRQATLPSRACPVRAVTEVSVTMIRLAVVASAGLKPSR
jgi:hypothetical protein